MWIFLESSRIKEIKNSKTQISVPNQCLNWFDTHEFNNCNCPIGYKLTNVPLDPNANHFVWIKWGF